MILEFKTQDNSIFVVDTVSEKWARVTTPANDPESKILENGKLEPKGFGVYGLSGRTPKSEPGNGVSTISAFLIPRQTTITLYVRANVEIKDLAMPVPFTEVLYKILPQDSVAIQQELESSNEK